jgi:hypothetical protein
MPIDAERFRTDGVYESQGTLAALAGDLQEIDRITLECRARRKRLGWLGFALLVTGIVFLSTGNTLLVVLGILLDSAAIITWIVAFRYGRGLLAKPYRCAAVRGFGDMLGEDADPKAPVTVRMALKDGKKLITQQEWPLRKKGKQRFYEDPWLSLEARMLDGTTFSETVMDLVRERSFVNPRGKSKTKTRVRHAVSVRFAYPSDLYGDASAKVGTLADSIKVPSTARVKGVRVTGRDIKAKAVVNRTEDLVPTGRMLALGVYRMLNLARKLSSHAKAEGGSR